MRMSEQTLRSLIRESLLNEAAITPKGALRAGIWFHVSKNANDATVLAYASGRDGSVGTLFSSITNNPCSDAWQIVYSKVRPDFDGLGPLMYDLMIDLISPHPLMSDRRQVSDDAKRVWDYYMTRRNDIKRLQLDDEIDTLTPDPSDNCAQSSAERREGERWTQSSLSGAYKRRRSGTPTIDALKKLGIIAFK